MSYETIVLERIGDIGKITFNRPEVLNAYNEKVSMELIAAIKEFSADQAVKVIVITGVGKAFMAGADINMVNAWSKQGDAAKIKESLAKMFSPNLLEDCPKPTIAAVNGLAFGMGCEVAVGCDYRIVSEKAKFALPEIKIGVIPGAGGSQRVLRLAGATKALEMITTGDPIDAQEAYRVGLVNQVVAPEKLWEAVEAFVVRLTDKGAAALKICKRLIYEGGELSLRGGVEFERDRFCEILLTEDANEGTAAFLEKRKPVFKGK
jgi:enoyl-CoA hydratase